MTVETKPAKSYRLVSPDEYNDDTIPLTLEEDVAESSYQTMLVIYLISVLRWYFRPQNWIILPNLAIYPPKPRDQYDHTDPDIAVFVGTSPPKRNIKSWRVSPPNRPAPTVVFEIASEGTWKNDLESKPMDYARMGVREYYAYDPNSPQLDKGGPRLRGWNVADRVITPLQPDAQGRMWSDALNSYLVPDKTYLRLTDRDGNIRLTEGEAAERIEKYLREQGINPDTIA